MFLFSKSNGNKSSAFSSSSSTSSATSSNQQQQQQQILSPFGQPCAIIPSTNGNVHRASGGVVPPALLEEKRVPKFYKDCLTICGANNSSQLPNTGLVYNLMIASQLPRDDLSDIWTMVNRTIPGQLTRAEFFSCLALIALAQKGENISALCNVTTLPIPHLQTFTEGNNGSIGGGNGKGNNGKISSSSVPQKNNYSNSKGAAVIETSDLNMKTKTSSIQSSKKDLRDNINFDFGGNGNGGRKPNNNKFIPTNLINNSNGATATEKKNDETTLVDLIDFYIPDSTTSQVPEDRKRESISYDLLNLDLSLPSGNSSFETGSKLTQQEFDPYSMLREGPLEDDYLNAWQQIINEGIKILNNTISVLQKSRPLLIEEIIQNERGIKFIQSNCAIAEVINRVALSLFKYRRENQKDLIENAKNSLILWKKFIKSNPNISKAVEKNYTNASSTDQSDSSSTTYLSFNGMAGFSSSSNYLKEQMFCGICIHNISFDDPNFIEFGDRHYHSPCANFWANLIDIGLPRLEKL